MFLLTSEKKKIVKIVMRMYVIFIILLQNYEKAIHAHNYRFFWKGLCLNYRWVIPIFLIAFLAATLLVSFILFRLVFWYERWHIEEFNNFPNNFLQVSLFWKH